MITLSLRIAAPTGAATGRRPGAGLDDLPAAHPPLAPAALAAAAARGFAAGNGFLTGQVVDRSA